MTEVVTEQSESLQAAEQVPPILASLVIASRSRSILECIVTSVNGSYPAKSSIVVDVVSTHPPN